MAVLLGFMVAVAFGSGDFIGARASQRSSTAGVLLVAQLAALAGAVLVAIVVSADVTGRDLAYGALAGTANVIGLGLLYHVLATGRMSIVAPVTAVVAALVPVTWGLIDGERPSTLVWGGVVCAIVAAALLAREPDRGERDGGRDQLLLAVAAGLGLGASFVFYGRTSVDSGNVPVLTARLAAAVLAGCAVAVLSRRTRVEMPTGRPRRLALAAGALDVLGATLLLVALRRGLAVVVAPVASLAPGVTVVLAWQVLRERISPAQVVGLGVAGVGLVLIASG